MNYELAKELKNAGFPQEAKEETGSYYALPIGYTHMFEAWRHDLKQPEIPCKIPNLEELIEACGEQYITICGRNGGNWIAFYGDVTEKARTNGATPKEAVARLWLALNKVK